MFSCRFLKMSMFLGTWMFLVYCGNPVAAQSNTRDYGGGFIPEYRRQLNASPSRLPPNVGSRATPGPAGSATSPRLQQFQLLQESRKPKDGSPRQPIRRYGGYGSTGISSTGLNPSASSILPQTNAALGAGRSPIRSARSAAKQQPADSVASMLPDVVFENEESPLPMREWEDNTGTFSTKARLIAISGNHVQLMKENARTATVPIRRLSVVDRQYIIEQAKLRADDPS